MTADKAPETPAMRRVHTASGHSAEVKACWTLSGPQTVDQMPTELLAYLEAHPQVSGLAVLYEPLLVGEGITLFRRMESDEEKSARMARVAEVRSRG